MNEFYIGYAARVPAGLRRFLVVLSALLGCLALVTALLLAFHQQPFADSRFDYLLYRDYTGAIEHIPYPTLVTSHDRYLLVAPGKHHANEAVGGLDLRVVHLKGSLIERGDDRMLEVLPGSVRTSGGAIGGAEARSLGAVTLDGEIVDSKCYMGVMNPGSGKVHRDCAARCISGGIPPAFAVRDAAGITRTILLAGPSGRATGKELLSMVAEPVRVRGDLMHHGETLVLHMAKGALQRLEKME